MRRSALCLVALFLAVLLPSAIPAQESDSAHVAHRDATRIQIDSLRAETCRGGTLSPSGLRCTGAQQATRVTVIRRLANRLDSLERVFATARPDSAVAQVELRADYWTRVMWPTGQIGALPTANTLLCAEVQVGATTYLGTPAVLATIVAPDSIAWREALVSGNADALRRECARDLPTWPVTWASVRVMFAQAPAAIPAPQAVVP